LLRASVMVRDVYATPERAASPGTVDVRSGTGDVQSGIRE